MSQRQRILDAMSGQDATPRGAITRTALSLFTPAYRAGNALRSAGFTLGAKRSYPLGRPTLSVGNLTTGGTGKTPMVQHLTRQLAEAGHKPCILLRGYKGGDEAEEHRRALGDLARVEPNPDRVAAAASVIADQPETTCFVLDDGFQHRRARRDLDLVLIDATNPWGFGRLLPRGLMREPKSALRRADAVLITRADQVDDHVLTTLDREIAHLTGRPPIAHTEHAWAGYRIGKPHAPGEAAPLNTLADQAVMGVVGIGNPDAFAKTLAAHAGQVVHCEQLPDHHRYTTSQLNNLIELAKAANATALVTTEKDWVKWSLLLEDSPPTFPIYRAALELRFPDGADTLMGLVNEKVRLV
ncbi:MAG: tetraacyldisaccharide 4'-kinase [Phycisphaerales bacterium JB063]